MGMRDTDAIGRAELGVRFDPTQLLGPGVDAGEELVAAAARNSPAIPAASCAVNRMRRRNSRVPTYTTTLPATA
jgi:hypothetical protein